MEVIREHEPFKSHLKKIEGSLEEIKDDLASAIRDQSAVVKDLTLAVKGLTDQISVWDRAVPVKLVMIMFGVLVASIGTIEAVRALLPLLKTL